MCPDLPQAKKPSEQTKTTPVGMLSQLLGPSLPGRCTVGAKVTGLGAREASSVYTS